MPLYFERYFDFLRSLWVPDDFIIEAPWERTGYRLSRLEIPQKVRTLPFRGLEKLLRKRMVVGYRHGIGYPDTYFFAGFDSAREIDGHTVVIFDASEKIPNDSETLPAMAIIKPSLGSLLLLGEPIVRITYLVGSQKFLSGHGRHSD